MFYAFYKFISVPQPRATAQSVFDDGLSTQTIYGFLDFTTTIGNTVMVFLPSSVPSTGRFTFFFGM